MYTELWTIFVWKIISDAKTKLNNTTAVYSHRFDLAN